jgi:hypothetical protein
MDEKQWSSFPKRITNGYAIGKVLSANSYGNLLFGE